MKRLKIGLDHHGVIDRNPRFFKWLSIIARSLGAEVHIITGGWDNDDLRNEMSKFGVEFDEVFSIPSTFSEHVKLDNNGKFSLPDLLWDSAKAVYCETKGITVHFDDTIKYKEYFLGTWFIHWKF